MRYLLDTNIVIAAMKGDMQVRKKLAEIPLSELALSPVVLGELEHGVEKGQHRDKNRSRLNRLVEGMHLIPLDAETSHRHG